MRTFLIVYTARTGSTTMFLHLNQHPNLAVAGDIFMRRVPEEVLYDISLLRIKNQHLSIDDYMTVFADVMADRNTKAVGFKCICHWLTHEHQKIEDLTDWVKRHRPHIIHVSRRSKAKQYISQKLAHARKKSHLLLGETARQVAISIPRDVLEERIAHITALDSSIAYNFQRSYPYMRVYYDDFVTNTHEVTGKICRFLGVPPMEDLPLPTKKISPTDLRTVVRNYHQLKDLI